MLKLIVPICGYLFSTMALSATSASLFPNGEFDGPGTYHTSNQNVGNYNGSALIVENDPEVTYSLTDAVHSVSFTFDFFNATDFSVSIGSETVGEGFCEIDRCHYHATVGAYEHYETIIFDGNEIDRQGLDFGNSSVTYWQDELEEVIGQ